MGIKPVLAVVAALALASGCSKSTDNSARQDAVIVSGVDPKAVEAVNQLVQADLDAGPMAVQRLLIALANAGQTTPDSLVIQQDGQDVGLDWWLWRRRLIEFKGLGEEGEALVGLSKAGAAVSAQPPSWLKAVSTPSQASKCDSGPGLGESQCELQLTVTFASTSLGKTLLNGATPPPMAVADAVGSAGRGWRADAVDYRSSPHPTVAVLNLALGSAEAQETARGEFVAELTAQAEAARAAPAPQTP